MATVHFLLQGKGGVGKSFVASLLFQYLKKRNLPVSGYDTDPVNQTFAGYKEFEIQTLDIMSGNDIDNARFDLLIDAISDLSEGHHLVVDNGASSFVTFCAYLKDNQAFELMTEKGHQIFMHVPVTGGQALPETITNLNAILQHFGEYQTVVWLNPKDGPISLNGHGFYDFEVYRENRDKLRAIVELPTYKPNTYGRDLAELLARRWSFEAGINSSLPLMTRSRLFHIWRDLEKIIDQACLI